VPSERPMEPGALLPIASVSKAMTAVALLREQEAGRIDLDAPVREYLPWLPLPTPFGPISVAHLLAHTSGIVSGMDGSPSPAAEALALGATAPGWPPGERARYSNVGYAVLGLVLERVAGCSYAEAIQRHVLDPCAMAGSEPVTTAEAQARAATGHLRLAGGALVPAPWVPTTAGSGAALCTAPDLARFLRAVVAGDPPLLAPASREAMLTPALPLPEGPGYCSYAYGCLETGVGVVALGNGPWRAPGPASTWAVVEHGLALLRAAALGQELPDDPPPPDPDPPPDVPSPATTPTELPGDLAPLVGTYAAWNPWVPQLRVRPDAEGAGLVLVYPDGDEAPLTPLPGGGFRIGDDPDSPERVEFTTLVEGRPMRAVVAGWPFDRLD
jgi:hypothetical protein